MHGARRRIPASVGATCILGNAGTALRPLTAALAIARRRLRDRRRAAHARAADRRPRRPAASRSAATIRYLGDAGLSAARDRRGPRAAPAMPVSVRGDVSSQFLTALLMALPLAHGARRPRATTHRGDDAADLAAVRRDHDQPDAALRRRRRRSPTASTFVVPAGARYRAPARFASRATRRRRRISSRPACSAAGPCACTGVGRDVDPGRRRVRRRARAAGRRRALRRRLDRGARRRGARGGEHRLHADSRRGDDARGHRAVRATGRRRSPASPAGASRRPIASPRWRPSSRKLGATVDAGADRLHDHPPRDARAGRRSTPTTITGWRCASRSPRSAACRSRSAIPGCVARRSPTTSPCFARIVASGDARDVTPSAGRRDRRAGGVGQGHDRRARRRGARLPLPRQRRAVPAGRAAGAADRASTPDDDAAAGGAGARARLSASQADRVLARASRRHRRRSATKRSRRRRRGWPCTPRSGRRCSTASGAFRRPPGLVADGRDMGTVVFPGRRGSRCS